jgi:hypothetical protein
MGTLAVEDAPEKHYQITELPSVNSFSETKNPTKQIISASSTDLSKPYFRNNLNQQLKQEPSDHLINSQLDP